MSEGFSQGFPVQPMTDGMSRRSRDRRTGIVRPVRRVYRRSDL